MLARYNREEGEDCCAYPFTVRLGSCEIAVVPDGDVSSSAIGAAASVGDDLAVTQSSRVGYRRRGAHSRRTTGRARATASHHTSQRRERNLTIVVGSEKGGRATCLGGHGVRKDDKSNGGKTKHGK